MKTKEQILEKVLALPDVLSAYIYGSNMDYICIQYVKNDMFWDYKICSWENLLRKIEKDLVTFNIT